MAPLPKPFSYIPGLRLHNALLLESQMRFVLLLPRTLRHPDRSELIIFFQKNLQILFIRQDSVAKGKHLFTILA